MDYTEIDTSALAQAMVDIRAELERRAADARAEDEERKAAIYGSIDALTALIGPDQPTAPAMGSITEVRLYSEADMHAHAGLGLALAFEGLELLARATRDIATAVSKRL